MPKFDSLQIRFDLFSAGLFAFAMMVGPAFAQPADETPDAPLNETPSAETSSPESIAFDEAIEAWRSATKKSWRTHIQIHSMTGDLTRKEQLQWAKGHAEMRDAMDIALAAGAALLRKDQKNQQALAFIMRSVLYRTASDWYEFTKDAAEALGTTGIDDPKFSAVLGLNAMAMNEFDLAEKELKIAGEAGALEEIGERLYYLLNDIRNNWKVEQDARAADVQRNDNPHVVLHTTRGDVLVELFEDSAPNTVANFISLVEEGFYDNVTFYHVSKNEYVQTGDPEGDGSGDAGYHIKDEHDADTARSVFRGSLLMAKLPNPLAEKDPTQPATIPNSGSCQFLITLLPMHAPLLEMTCFGRVLEGIGAISTVNRVSATEKAEGPQRLPDSIISAEVVRKREHAYEPEVIE